MSMPTIDEDPCAVLAQLRTIYRNLITGKVATKVYFRSGSGSERETAFGKADIPALSAEIRKYEGLCATSCGATNPARRHMIRAG